LKYSLIAATVLFILIGVGVAVFSGFGGGTGDDLGVTIKDKEVIVSAGDIEARFTRVGSFSTTLMLFGGTYTKDKNAVSPVIIAGLDANSAKRIYASYPDFYMCKSRGAKKAMKRIKTLSMIATDSKTLQVVTSALDEFKTNLTTGGDRICIKLQGDKLKLVSVLIPKANTDITAKFKSLTFYLMTGAKKVPWKTVLEK